MDGWFELSLIRHIGLQALVLEGAYVSRQVLDTLGKCVFPELVHLELWQGNDELDMSEEYQRLVAQSPFPKLRHLGIRNYGKVDEICEFLNGAEILKGLDTLDLSLGMLSDDGAESLLKKPSGLRS